MFRADHGDLHYASFYIGRAEQIYPCFYPKWNDNKSVVLDWDSGHQRNWFCHSSEDSGTQTIVAVIREEDIVDGLVSIIVPVYNAENYLEACLTSLITQTYDNLEIIVVNDGSTDGSGTICDVFARKDSRIRVIDQENRGVSAARNAGLDVMTGEYLLFADGDDTLAPETVALSLKGFIRDEIDVTIFGVTKVWEEEDRCQQLPMETGIYSNKDMLYGILKDYSSFGAGFPVNKVWRVKAFGGILCIPRFDQELYYFEDLEWVVRMLLSVQKANLLPDHCYRYYVHPDSTTHKPGAQERRETGYHQSVWKILQALRNEPAILQWFALRYYPEVVNGVINAWQNKRPNLRKMLLCKLDDIEKEILWSDSISRKVKFRCIMLRILHKLRLL